MKYKVGDKVRVRKDLIVGSRYGHNTFVSQMQKFSGKIMTIDDIKSDNFKSNNFYVFKGDPDEWYWTDEMLEDVEDITILVKDNKVIAKMGDKYGVAKCSPEDEFDIFIGAKLALDRLEEECKPYSWLKEGMIYYYPHVSCTDLYGYCNYNNDEFDKRRISRGIVFRTKEEAIKVAKKMLEVVK